MNQTGVTSVRSRRHALRNRGRGRDNRRLASLLSDEDGVALELDLIRRDGMHRRTGKHAPRLEREHALVPRARHGAARRIHRDRKSTRLNSSHTVISYAVFCLKKKNSNVEEKT